MIFHNFPALGTNPTVTDAQFKEISAGGAVDASDRILYDLTTGELFYDSDGSGAVLAFKIAVLSNHAVLTAQDFFVAFS